MDALSARNAGGPKSAGHIRRIEGKSFRHQACRYCPNAIGERCCHLTKRKTENHLRNTKPHRAVVELRQRLHERFHRHRLGCNEIDGATDALLLDEPANCSANICQRNPRKPLFPCSRNHRAEPRDDWRKLREHATSLPKHYPKPHPNNPRVRLCLTGCCFPLGAKIRQEALPFR